MAKGMRKPHHRQAIAELIKHNTYASDSKIVRSFARSSGPNTFPRKIWTLRVGLSLRARQMGVQKDADIWLNGPDLLLLNTNRCGCMRNESGHGP